MRKSIGNSRRSDKVQRFFPRQQTVGRRDIRWSFNKAADTFPCRRSTGRFYIIKQRRDPPLMSRRFPASFSIRHAFTQPSYHVLRFSIRSKQNSIVYKIEVKIRAKRNTCYSHGYGCSTWTLLLNIRKLRQLKIFSCVLLVCPYRKKIHKQIFSSFN